MITNDEDTRKNRITININNFHNEILNKLKGHCGDSISSIVNYMIKDWINNNSKKIIDDFKINLPNIQSKYYYEKEEIVTDIPFNDIKKKIIDTFPRIFTNTNSIQINDLAELLNTKTKTIIEIFTFHSKELQKIDIKLKLENNVVKIDSS